MASITSATSTFDARELAASLTHFGRFFYTQKGAIDHARGHGHALVFACDKGSSKCYGTEATHAAFIDRLMFAHPTDRNFYELLSDLHEICFYVDVEIEVGDRSSMPTDRQLFDSCVSFVAYGMRHIVGIDVSGDNFRATVASTDTKRSLHLVLRGHAFAPANVRTIGKAMFELLQRGPSSPELEAHRLALMRRGGSTLNNAYVMDFTVYSSNRVMRTINSTKIGQNRPLLRFVEHEPSRLAPVIEFFITYVDPIKDSLNTTVGPVFAAADVVDTVDTGAAPSPVKTTLDAMHTGGNSGLDDTDGRVDDDAGSDWEPHAATALRLMLAIRSDAKRRERGVYRPTANGCIVRFNRSAAKCPFSGTVHSSNRTDVVLWRHGGEGAATSEVRFMYRCHGCNRTEPMIELHDDDGSSSSTDSSVDGVMIFRSDSSPNVVVQLGEAPHTVVCIPLGLHGDGSRPVYISSVMLGYAFMHSLDRFDTAKFLLEVTTGDRHDPLVHVIVPRIATETACVQLASLAGPLQKLMNGLEGAMKDEGGMFAAGCAITEYATAISDLGPQAHAEDEAYARQLLSLSVALLRR